MIPAFLLSRVNWRRVLGLGATALIVVLVLYVRLQQIALEQARVIYQNPRKVEKVRVVVVRGPVRIVTRTIKEPGGREETVREETQGPVTEVTDTVKITEPVMPTVLRSDRWLVGFSLDPLHYRDRADSTAWAGYSFRNRLDLCAGVRGRGRPGVLVMVRF